MSGGRGLPLRAGGHDVSAGRIDVGKEIVTELRCQGSGGPLPVTGIFPRPGRNEDLRRNPRHLGDRIETEHRIAIHRRPVEGAAVNRVDDPPRRGQIDASPLTVGAPGPAGVHQPRLGTVTGELLLEEPGVDVRMADEERGAEAG